MIKITLGRRTRIASVLLNGWFVSLLLHSNENNDDVMMVDGIVDKDDVRHHFNGFSCRNCRNCDGREEIRPQRKDDVFLADRCCELIKG